MCKNYVSYVGCFVMCKALLTKQQALNEREDRIYIVVICVGKGLNYKF
jgi:hypothetical protein